MKGRLNLTRVTSQWRDEYIYIHIFPTRFVLPEVQGFLTHHHLNIFAYFKKKMLTFFFGLLLNLVWVFLMLCLLKLGGDTPCYGRLKGENDETPRGFWASPSSPSPGASKALNQRRWALRWAVLWWIWRLSRESGPVPWWRAFSPAEI